MASKIIEIKRIDSLPLAEAEGAEAGRDRYQHPWLGGVGVVDDGEAREVAHPDIGEVDAARRQQ
jgi:hypothetical protein